MIEGVGGVKFPLQVHLGVVWSFLTQRVHNLFILLLRLYLLLFFIILYSGNFKISMPERVII